MTSLRFQTTQKSSSSLRSSEWHFVNSMDVISCSITEQSKPSFVLTVSELFNILSTKKPVHESLLQWYPLEMGGLLFP